MTPPTLFLTIFNFIRNWITAERNISVKVMNNSYINLELNIKVASFSFKVSDSSWVLERNLAHTHWVCMMLEKSFLFMRLYTYICCILPYYSIHARWSKEYGLKDKLTSCRLFMAKKKKVAALMCLFIYAHIAVLTLKQYFVQP